MKKIRILFLFMLVALTSAAAQTDYFPPVAGGTWETVSPAALGWGTEPLNNLHSYLDEKETKAFIILKDGRIAVEWYFGTFQQDSLWYWASAGKTITAFLIGMAREEGLLSISDKTSDYLGAGWTSCPPEKESLITIRHQLTMTTGLDYDVADPYNTEPSSLLYKADAGTQWFYHNAPYTLLREVIEAASGQSENLYTHSRLTGRIGMDGFWLMVGYNNVYFSTARSMARFGLLIQHRGIWDSDTLMHDSGYFNSMVTPSQDLNPSYGYLWWLNGQGRYMLPGLTWVFNSDLIPTAPDDLVAALGKNDQKVYVVNSLGLVVIRMGENAGQSMLALSSFDNTLWGLIMDLYTNPVAMAPDMSLLQVSLGRNYPNPFNPATTIRFTLAVRERVHLAVYNAAGRRVAVLADGVMDAGCHELVWNAADRPSGVYICRIRTETGEGARRMLLLK
ncbi:serine hydrolase [bacterium]|nr:serine hydrolase [bacterium]